MKPEPFDVRELALFEGLSAMEIAKLRPMLKKSNVSTGVTIFRKGATSRYVCVLVRGSVKVCVLENDAPAVMLAMLGAGEVLGEVSAVDGLPHSADVVTLERSLFVTMSRDDFCLCLDTMPRFARNLSVLLTRRLRDATTQLHSVASQDVAGRVARQLIAFARRYASSAPDAKEGTTPQSIVIPIRVTQSDLGELVGASRVRVNEVVVGFKRRGVISVDGNCRITIHDLSALSRVAGDEAVRSDASSIARDVVRAEATPLDVPVRSREASA